MVVFPGMETMRTARPIVTALALGVALVAGGCGTAGSPDAGQGSGQTVAVGDVRLEASASVGLATGSAEPGVRAMPGLVVDYTLTNTGTTDLVAFDVVPDDLGSAVLPADVDHQHAWVYVEEGTVRVSKQAFEPAPGVRFIAAPTTGVRDLPAGGVLTGRAQVPTPLELDVPGSDFSAPRAEVPPGAGEFRFCVQVGERTPQLRPSGVGSDVLEAPLVAPADDELVCTGPMRMPVA